jgi:hypothetical protein
MPSTFTDSGIELIADGEQTGLWGQTTNLNLQIIDRLTSQAGTITLSGTTHTLTVSAGALSDGQYGVLVFAGSPSGTNTVTISPNTAQRTFIVRNTTTESVVLTQGSGGNVTVPTATTKIVYSDGGGASAAVVDLTSTLAANLLGNVTGNVTGNATGNAGTATALQTARTFTIGATGRTFDGTANVSWTTVEIGAVGQTATTGAALIPVGTEAQRPSPVTGQFRFNSDLTKFEGYNGTAWGAVGGGATGGGADEIFIQNGQTVTTNYTIPATVNAMSTGPITINAGVTVTVSTGARYVVI